MIGIINSIILILACIFFFKKYKHLSLFYKNKSIISINLLNYLLFKNSQEKHRKLN